MTSSFSYASIQSTAEWFNRARPETTSKDFHAQTGCHFEEVCEMLEQLDSGDEATHTLLVQAERSLQALANHLKASDNVLIIKSDVLFLDSLCDQVVTGTGVAHTRRYQFIDALAEVNASNWSKFVDGKPIYDDNKKVIKGAGYFKANLQPFV